jgi:serine/threonine-protein kinase
MLVGQTIGPFEVESELGSGAMGTVYLARWRRDDGRVVKVALKMVALGLLGNEGAMARFEREANILKQLRHPHIVKLHATGTYRKTPFIAMEYIEGEALDRVLARRGRLAWEEVLTLGKQLCEALQYAHDKGIIHRDLKPSNLMIARGGVLKLTDFGIAKDTDVTALTGQNSTIGTAAYMSPEQCKGDKNLSNKSDLYSLGIVFYELITGKKPFYAETTVDMFLKHVNEKPPRIGKQVNDLPVKLEALILQLMEKDKDDRPTDATWVARMLTEIEEDGFTRKSAGLDAATKRRGDKPRNNDGSTLDEEDRDAARALRGKKKKARKKATVPFLERKWVKAAAIILVLAGIAAGGYFAFRAPSAETLARAIDAADTPEGKFEAAKKYLEAYGGRPGEHTDRAAAVFKEAATRKREEQLANRFARQMSKPDEADDKEAFENAWLAMGAEDKGDLKLATAFWEKVRARFPDEAKLPFALEEGVLAKARWGWVAEKRLVDLRKVDRVAAATRQKIENNRKYEVAFPNDVTNAESVAMRAFRTEEFGDRERADREWERLASLTEKDPDRREWFLLASQQYPLERRSTAKPPGDATLKERLALVTRRVDEAAALAESLKANPDDSTRILIRLKCREVTDLYDDEKDEALVAQVKRAKAIAATVPKT